MEQLTFKSLLIRFGFDDILPEFKALYQRNQPKQAQHANWEAYRRLTVACIKNFRRMMFLNPNMPFIWYQGGKDAHR